MIHEKGIMPSVIVPEPFKMQGTCNTRELGGYPAFSGMTQMHRCLRSDSLHGATEQDIDFLLSYPVSRVIDLRSCEEAAAEPEVQNWATEIEYFHVSLDDKMSAEGYKGKLPDRLGELYQQILSENKRAVLQILELIADAPRGAVLFNCAVGKDRTGVIAMLLLKICGVEDDVIIEDYKVSGKNIIPIADRQTRMLKEKGIVLPHYIFESKEEDMRDTLKFLNQEYGGIAGYLQELGISGASVWKIMNRLCAL